VVHRAFQIRQLYGRRKGIQRRWNIGGAREVIAFAFGEPSVRRLIHFSTVTAYGADKSNSLAERLSEKAPLTERDYLYGSHKREIEQVLKDAYAASDQRTHVVILRCASISGPYGRFALGRFGIVSTLTGMLPFLPCGRPDFGRQYLHEDDIAEIIGLLLTAPSKVGYEVFNASPHDYLASADLASLPQKRRIIIPPALLRRLFALCWRFSRGRVPMPRGAWKFLTYPIAVDGSALTGTYNYRYQFSSADALMARAGRHSAIAAAPAVERHGGEPNTETIP
jgi:nucleoside-diphosphate-sugar epimerase